MNPLTLICAAATVGLAACGGGGNASVQGSVSGLDTGQSVVLQDNGNDSLTVSANGTFSFATALATGSTSTVTALTQPTGQFCQVANATDTIDNSADSVNTVAVACVNTASLGGTVSGLPAGTAVTLSNRSVLLPVATHGTFAFPGVLVTGTAWQVSIAPQPAGQTCTRVYGSATISAASLTAMTVTCS